MSDRDGALDASHAVTPALLPRVTTVLLIAAALLTALAIGFVTWRLGQPSVIRLLHWWLVAVQGDDSWKPMRAAYAWFTAGHATTIYQHVFFEQHVKFQYPPSSLLIFAVPDALGLTVSNKFLNVIGWMSVAVVAAATGILAWWLTRDWPELGLRLAVSSLAAIVGLTFYPIQWAYTEGQIQLWFSALFAIAALCWLAGYKRTAGALIGVICFAKPQFLLFLVWALWRRQYRFAAAMGVVLALTLAASLMAFGWANHVDYLAALSYMSHHGETWIRNYSVNGVMNRLVGNSYFPEFQPNAYPPYHPLVYWTTVVTSAGLIGLALFRRRDRTAGLMDFFIVALSLTMASPIAWEHHYGILPPVFIALALTLPRAPRRSWIAAAALFLAFVACDVFLPPIAALATGPLSLLQSTVFFGAVTVLVLLYRYGDLFSLPLKPHKYALAVEPIAEQPAHRSVRESAK